jgi:hypothetical protein
MEQDILTNYKNLKNGDGSITMEYGPNNTITVISWGIEDGKKILYNTLTTSEDHLNTIETDANNQVNQVQSRLDNIKALKVDVLKKISAKTPTTNASSEAK